MCPAGRRRCSQRHGRTRHSTSRPCFLHSGLAGLTIRRSASIAAGIPGLLVHRLVAERTSAEVEAQAENVADLARSDKSYSEHPAASVGQAIRKTLAS